jgi:tripartite-type tricarboxylate transporter receptor subunit TctC
MARNARAAALLLFASLSFAANSAETQPFPQKPLRWLLPYAPGGGSDATTRNVAQKLSEFLGQPVVVDNRAGASGKIAVELAARAPADGYTLITITPSMVSNQNLGDFAPITQMISQGYVVVVHPSLPATSLKELIALARARPGMLHYGSAGIETMQHVGGALFGVMTGTDLVHVPYKGGSQAMTDLLSGQLQFHFAAVVTSIGHIKAGKARALAVTSSKRAALLPELPTIAEAGVPGYALDNWYGVAAPPRTPRPIVLRLNADAVRALRSPEVIERIRQDGAEPVGNTADEFIGVIKETIRRWHQAVKAAGLR